MVYLDESGISSKGQDPHCVVAGVIVDPDRQLFMTDCRLRALVQELPPSMQKPEKFVFHATELYSGGRTFPRDTVSKEDRWTILRDLASIPADSGLPVIYGIAHRNKVEEAFPGLGAAQLAVKAQELAYTACMWQLERWMRERTGGNEIAQVIAENNDQAKKPIKECHDFFRNSDHFTILDTKGYGGFALTSIMDTVHFAQKADCSMLQLADMCAFILKRFFGSAPSMAKFYDELKPALYLPPSQQAAISE